MRIKVYCIPDCPNCKRLKMLLNRQGIEYEERTFDPENIDDMAFMAKMGIYDAQYPVVYINKRRLPAMTVEGYMERIMG